MERARSGEIERLGRGLLRWLGGPSGLGVHLGLFLSVASVLALLNVAFSSGSLWFWRPLAWWGGLLAVHAVVACSLAYARSTGAAPPSQSAGRAAVDPARAALAPTKGARAAAAVRAVGDRFTTAAVETLRRLPRVAADQQRSLSVPGSPAEADSSRRLATGSSGRSPAEHGQPGDAASFHGPVGDRWRRARGRVAALVAGHSSPAPAGAPSAAPQAAPGSWPEWGAPAAAPLVPDQPPSTGHPAGTNGVNPIPADVAALWASGRSGSDRQRATPGGSSPPPGRARPSFAARAGRGTAGPRPAVGEDVLVHGPATNGTNPVPADWRSIEQEAAAWLEQRGAAVAPRSPVPPVPPDRAGERWTASGD